MGGWREVESSYKRKKKHREREKETGRHVEGYSEEETEEIEFDVTDHILKLKY